MAEGDESIDDAVDSAERSQATRNPAATTQTSLTDAITGIPDLVSNVVKKTYYSAKAAAPLAASYVLGGIPVLVSSAISALGFIFGKLIHNKQKKKETTFEELANETAIGASIGGLLHYAFIGGANVGNAVAAKYGAAAGYTTKAAAGLASIPPFMETHEMLNRTLIHEYEPVPWEKRKEDMKQVFNYGSLPIAANWAIVPPMLQMPAAAAITTGYAYGKSRMDNQRKEAA